MRVLVITLFCASVTLQATDQQKPTSAVDAELRYLSEVEDAIDKLIEQTAPHAHVGICVTSLKTGEIIMQRNADKLFVPASNTKLFTAAAALSLLGKDYQFVTKIFSDGSLQHGSVLGNIYVQGVGDPSMTKEDLRAMVQKLKDAGIQQIMGDIVIDSNEFDIQLHGPGWSADMEEYYSVTPFLGVTKDNGRFLTKMPVDSVAVDHNCVLCWVKPTAQGKSPMIKVEDSYENLPIINVAKTSAKKTKATIKVERRWFSDRFVILVEGSIPIGSAPLLFKLPVTAPDRQCGFLMSLLCAEIGIEHIGETVIGQPTPPQAAQLAEHRSQPLHELIAVMLKTSDNLYADALFKKLASHQGLKPASWQQASTIMRDFLVTQVHLPANELVVTDGSGLSRYNLVSPAHMVQLLTWLHACTFCDVIKESLSVAGVDGTLAARMQLPELHGKIRGKTGTLLGLSSLSGYLYTEDDVYAFSILTNGLTDSPLHYEAAVEDKLCQILMTSLKNIRKKNGEEVIAASARSV